MTVEPRLAAPPGSPTPAWQILLLTCTTTCMNARGCSAATTTASNVRRMIASYCFSRVPVHMHMGKSTCVSNAHQGQQRKRDTTCMWSNAALDDILMCQCDAHFTTQPGRFPRRQSQGWITERKAGSAAEEKTQVPFPTSSHPPPHPVSAGGMVL